MTTGKKGKTDLQLSDFIDLSYFINGGLLTILWNDSCV